MGRGAALTRLRHESGALWHRYGWRLARGVIVGLLLALALWYGWRGVAELSGTRPVATSQVLGDGRVIRHAGPSSDLRAFWLSGQQTLRGENPYAAEDGGPPNLNPPVALPLFMALALLPWPVAVWAWWAVSWAAILLALWSLRGAGATRLLWVLALSVVAASLRIGQVYPLLLPVAALACLGLRDRRPLLAGVTLGALAAVKPPFALILVALALARVIRPAVIGGLVATGCWLLALGLGGWSLHANWLAVSASVSMTESLARSVEATNMSLTAQWAAWGLPQPLLAGAVGVTLALALVWCHRLGPVAAALAGLAIALLAGPLAWSTYLMLAAPGLMLLTSDRRWWLAALALIVLPILNAPGLACLAVVLLAALLPPMEDAARAETAEKAEAACLA